MTYPIRPLTPDQWPAFVDLFDNTGGSCSRYWCMYWRAGNLHVLTAGGFDLRAVAQRAIDRLVEFVRAAGLIAGAA